jgi:hypothetical protein
LHFSAYPFATTDHAFVEVEALNEAIEKQENDHQALRNTEKAIRIATKHVGG